MTNEQLIEQIRTGQDSKTALEKLYRQNNGIIRKTAREIAGKYTDNESRLRDLQDDLSQEAYFGLIEAVNKWDPARGITFLTYALYWIRQAMTRFCYLNMCIVQIPESRQTQIRKYNRLINEYRKQAGQELPDKEAARLMKVDLATVQRIKEAACFMKPVSIDQTIRGDTDNTITIADSIKDSRNQYEDLLEDINRKELAAVIWPMVDSLPRQQADTLRQYYKNGRSIAQISKETGKTTSKLQAARRLGIDSLKHHKQRAKLKAFYERDCYSHGLRGGLQSWKESFTSATEKAAFEMLEKEQEILEKYYNGFSVEDCRQETRSGKA